MHNISCNLTIPTLLFFVFFILSTDHSNLLIFTYNKVKTTVQLHNASMLQLADSTSNMNTDKEKSDTFYYILGIVILIVAAILFKKRYEQYLHDKDQLNN
jgi:LPXTG-motif cell wall-anchored protein